jgi:hypothetical protein
MHITLSFSKLALTLLSSKLMLLVCRAIFHKLGLAPSSDDHDLYEETRQHPLVYHAKNDPSVIEEMRIHEQEAKSEITGSNETIDDLSDESDGEWDGSEDEDEGASPQSSGASESKKSKTKKMLSVPEKVCLLFRIGYTYH